MCVIIASSINWRLEIKLQAVKAKAELVIGAFNHQISRIVTLPYKESGLSKHP